MKKLTVLTGSERTQPKVSQGKNYPPTGLLSLIFCQFKVTASEESKPYPEVTVSMTSEDAVGYTNLSSPKRAIAKYRQYQIPMPEVTVTSRNPINGLASAYMGGLRSDNQLNIKAYSAFVQTTGKEKGPEVSPALLPTSLISCTGESDELHHNSHLQATSFAQCQPLLQSLDLMSLLSSSRRNKRLTQPDLLSSPSSRMAIDSRSDKSLSNRNWTTLRSFFSNVDIVNSYEVACSRVDNVLHCMTCSKPKPGSATTLTGPLTTNDNASIEVAMRNYTALIGKDKPSFTQARPEFLETYWIVPFYETTPYGKVSFTRQDRRTFIAMFKDSRLIWAGRQPVKYFTENVKRTQSPKLPVEGIEEISTTQGGVNIAPPSTITEIVTVQVVAHA
ncbi:hypothetical protein [Symbiopectobacterium purcellii]|uniref:hypothetical protein n=1 Tax=Symbiopectobacterium purcellii TaxID=2871826 RepID=UPI003F867488